MPGYIVHELPDGSGVVETFVGGELAAVTVHPDSDQAAEAASDAMSGDNAVIAQAVEAKRQEIRDAKEAELDVKYPWRHEHPAKLVLRGIAFSLTHWGAA